MDRAATRSEPGVYLTDGRDLFRIVSLLTPEGGGGTAELENCRTLETTLLTADELWRLDLRPVN